MATNLDELMRQALEDLCGGKTNAQRRHEVAAKIDYHEQTLYQIINSIPNSRTGKPNTVASRLRKKLDEEFPGWMSPKTISFPAKHDAITQRILNILEGADEETRLDCLQAVQRIVEGRTAALRSRASGE